MHICIYVVMEILWFIKFTLLLAVAGLAFAIGYRCGLRAKRLVIESLSFKQAMKLWQIHELIRHEDDKRNIRRDLKKLADVEMPPGVDYRTWFDVK